MSARPKSKATITPTPDIDGYQVIDSDGDTCGTFQTGEEREACLLLLSIAEDERGMDDEHWEADQVAVAQQAMDTRLANKCGDAQIGSGLNCKQD